VAYPYWRASEPASGAFTAALHVNFRRNVPTGAFLKFEAFVEKVDRNKIFLKGRIYDPQGALLATSLSSSSSPSSVSSSLTPAPCVCTTDGSGDGGVTFADADGLWVRTATPCDKAISCCA
jgi:hypothetical protein